MMDAYYIKWYDAFNIEGWFVSDEEKDTDSILEVETVGFLFKENEKYISILQSSGNNGRSIGLINIPNVCIIEKRKL